MERPYILHMFTPGPQMSPFDVNMAADAGYQIITPYCGIGLEAVAGLTQDAIFSRGPKGVARTGIFIGGRDVLLAADMLERANKAMVPPFVVSLFADPSGSYTTAAALVACTEAALKKHHGTDLAGKRVLLLGGTGTVGRIAGVLCAQVGATALLSSHRGVSTAEAAAAETGQRFGVTLHGISGQGEADLRASLADADRLRAGQRHRVVHHADARQPFGRHRIHIGGHEHARGEGAIGRGHDLQAGGSHAHHHVGIGERGAQVGLA